MTSKRFASLRVMATLLGALILTSCYSATLTYGSRRYDGHGARHRVVVSNIVWGLESIGEVDLEKYCKETKIEEVRTRVTVIGAVVQFFSLGFYTPLTVRITCTPPTPTVGDEDSRPEVAKVNYEFVPVGEQPTAPSDIASQPTAPMSREPEDSDAAPTREAAPEANPYD